MGGHTDLATYKLLTTHNIAYKMLGIFANHVGKENAITRAKLFRVVFNRPEKESLSGELRWEFCRRAMHLLRVRTRCFIGSRFNGRTWEYFVLRSHSDADEYCSVLENNIRKMRAMQMRAKKAVDGKWHEVNWLAECRQQKTLKGAKTQ
jgi:hypothetical protein